MLGFRFRNKEKSGSRYSIHPTQRSVVDRGGKKRSKKTKRNKKNIDEKRNIYHNVSNVNYRKTSPGKNHNTVAHRSIKKMIVLFLFIGFLVALIILALTSTNRAWRWLHDSPAFAISKVQLMTPVQHISNDVFQAIVKQHLHGNYFSLDTKQLVSAFMQLGWVSQVGVRRVWPHRVQIALKEYQPLAVWNANAILTQSGQVIYPPLNSIPQQLMHFSGSDQDASAIAAFYQYAQQALLPLHLTINQVTLSPIGLWSLGLQDGVKIVLGYNNINNKLDSFIKVYPFILSGHMQQVLQVNMQYSNGLAVAWRR